MATKRISVDELAIGMYVVSLDRPWPPHPATTATRHRIVNDGDIARFKALGARYVMIDPTLGKDSTVQTPPRAVLHTPPPTARLDSLTSELDKARTLRAEALTTMQSIFEGVKTGAPINVASVKQTVHSLIDSVLRHHDTLLCLNHLRQYDAEQFTHAVDVCVFTLVIGKHQNLPPAQLEQLGMGALLHDVGKMRLPRNLLHKQEAYTADERYLMQQHPRLGATVLLHAEEIPAATRRMVVEHHERLNSSGYPAGLKGEAISPLSMIVGIADVYDTLLSGRYGRPRLLPAQAIKALYQCSLKGEFDSLLVERVVRCLGIYPVGSLVELSTGERGIVRAANPTDALRPAVQIIWDASQQPYPTPRLVSLAAPPADGPERTIVCTLDPAKENLDISRYLEESDT